jgi:hypothetical protein
MTTAQWMFLLAGPALGAAPPHHWWKYPLFEPRRGGRMGGFGFPENRSRAILRARYMAVSRGRGRSRSPFSPG